MTGSQRDQLFNHPMGLFVCFGTELWERFSYYGMRALLIFYLTQHFLFTDSESFAIYGAYTALVWGLPVIGGIVADRWLGSRKAVTIGAILLTCGHLLLVFEGPPAIEAVSATGRSIQRDGYHIDLFFLSLALIVTGVGFLKANITTVVGALYDKDDPRRDAGYTIFYLGMNSGGALAPLVCGWVGQTYGWSYGFGLAGIGMLIGLTLFLWGQRFLHGHAEPPNADWLKQSAFAGIKREWLIYGGALVLVMVAWLLLCNQQFIGPTLSVFSAILATFILYFSFARCEPVERDRMLVVTALLFSSILFWALYEQMGSSLSLFSDRLVDRRILGLEIQASQLLALPATLVVLFAPVFALLWAALALRNVNPSIPVKFAMALMLIGIAFVMPMIGAALAGPGQKIGLLWFVLIFAFMVAGELCMGPIAMNMIAKLCPKRVVGMMMGALFLSLSIGSFVAAELAKLTSRPGIRAGQNPIADIANYISTFELFAMIGVGGGLAVLMISPFLKARMHEREAR